MTPINPASAPRRLPAWGGWCVGDLAEATAATLAVTMREGPIVGVVSSGISAAEPRQDGRSAALTTVRERIYGSEKEGRRQASR